MAWRLRYANPARLRSPSGSSGSFASNAGINTPRRNRSPALDTGEIGGGSPVPAICDGRNSGETGSAFAGEVRKAGSWTAAFAARFLAQLSHGDPITVTVSPSIC